jgi:hypothetical protein
MTGAQIVHAPPWPGAPAGEEHGHAKGCQRLAAQVAEWLSQRD